MSATSALALGRAAAESLILDAFTIIGAGDPV